MIPQEKEVCSLELSKKLKELGVLQESKFYWFKNYFPDGYLKKGEWELVSGKPLFQKDETVVCDNDCYSAYTIGELLEMLPNRIEKNGEYASLEIRKWNNKYTTEYHEAFEYPLSAKIKFDNLANSLAEMLIYLIENNYITVEEINNKN